MPYNDVSNLVTVTVTNVMDEMACGYAIQRTTAVRMRHHVSWRTLEWFQLLAKSPTDLHRRHSGSKIRLFYEPNIVESRMHLHNSRYFRDYLRMHLQSQWGLCVAPGGPGSIGNYFDALVRSTGVSGRLVYCSQINLHFADLGLVRQYMLLQTDWASKGIPP